MENSRRSYDEILAFITSEDFRDLDYSYTIRLYITRSRSKINLYYVSYYG